MNFTLSVFYISCLYPENQQDFPHCFLFHFICLNPSWPYTGMCVNGGIQLGIEDLGENMIFRGADSEHSGPRAHKKTFLLSVLLKRCFLRICHCDFPERSASWWHCWGASGLCPGTEALTGGGVAVGGSGGRWRQNGRKETLWFFLSLVFKDVKIPRGKRIALL